MARETKEQLAARIVADNDAASRVPTATSVETLFGTTILGPKIGTGDDGWDLYEVTHSGYTYQWASGIVWRTFRQDSDQS